MGRVDGVRAPRFRAGGYKAPPRTFVLFARVGAAPSRERAKLSQDDRACGPTLFGEANGEEVS